MTLGGTGNIALSSYIAIKRYTKMSTTVQKMRFTF
jgi:hypothetical protein